MANGMRYRVLVKYVIFEKFRSDPEKDGSEVALAVDTSIHRDPVFGRLFSTFFRFFIKKRFALTRSIFGILWRAMTYFDDFEYFVTFSFIMDSDAVRARADTVDLVRPAAIDSAFWVTPAAGGRAHSLTKSLKNLLIHNNQKRIPDFFFAPFGRCPFQYQLVIITYLYTWFYFWL